MLKTYSGLIKNLNIRNEKDFIPILYYLNEKVRYTNAFLPQETNIMRGKDFFNKFTKINFEELNNYFKNIGEDKDIIKIFNDLLNKI